MPSRKPSRKTLRSLCAEVHPDDGVDPRDQIRQGLKGQKSLRKARQLCGQVAEALDAVFAGDCGDDVLRNLQVVAVAPAPDASRLLVTVRVQPPTDAVTPVQVLEHLARATGRLRYAVTSAITRRRAPVLVYQVAVPTEGVTP